MSAIDVVDAETVPWVNGREVYESMEPAFRENLDVHGDQERVLDLLSRYSIRTLWLDPTTSRRIDHLRASAGYVDLSEAYHDSVEEALFLGGKVTLSAEGVMERGDYFWRPPGWVHSAESADGFEAFLMMEGEVCSEGSGRVSRVPRPDDRVAHNDRPESSEDPLGPRGYVRHLETRFMVWRDHDDSVTGLGARGLQSKLLSSNAVTGACSTLVRMPAGWTSTVSPSTRERFLLVADGTLEVNGKPLTVGSLVHLGAGEGTVHLSGASDVELLVKVGESL